MPNIEAETIASSIWTSNGKMGRIATLRLKYPWFIHNELMTHRDFSRSASSSRAVPIKATIEQVTNDPAHPEVWGAHQPGMQPAAPLTGRARDTAEAAWRQASRDAVASAMMLQRMGLHKQIVNRVIEPYKHIHVVVTSTQWQNFFRLRLSENAQAEMRILAERMFAALEGTPPRLLSDGEWHVPFCDLRGSTEAMQSAAMCARVSYNKHDGERPTRGENEELAKMLLAQHHMSPFEHQARPAFGRFDNFHNWRSFRFDLENPGERYQSPLGGKGLRHHKMAEKVEMKFLGDDEDGE